MAKILLRGVAGFIGITSSLVSLSTYYGRTRGNLVKIFGFPCSYGLPEHNNAKKSTGLPLSTSVKGVDRKFDLFQHGSGFVEAGLWSIEIPQKPTWCHNLCIQVWWEVQRAKILLRGVPASSASLPP